MTLNNKKEVKRWLYRVFYLSVKATFRKLFSPAELLQET